jgi:Sulfotransferase family
LIREAHVLLSYSKRFLFIANTKTGSTTIEKNLRRHAEIAIPSTKHGKHMSYSFALKSFKFVFRKTSPVEDYFRFGVVRDPLEWVVSWYNYLHREQMLKDEKKKKKSTQGVSFEQYAAQVMSETEKGMPGHIGTQQAKFVTKDGELGVDYLIPLRRLNTDLQRIATELGIKKPLPPDKERANESPRIISTKDVQPELAERLRKHFADDLALYKKAEANGFGDLSEIIRRKREQAEPLRVRRKKAAQQA